MNRRTFLRRLAILLVLGGAAAAGLRKWSLPNNSGTSDSADDTQDQAGSDTPLQPLTNASQSVAGKKDDGSLFSFMILSDLHINSFVTYPSEHLRQALEDVLDFETKVETIVLTGDLTEAATRADYKEFRKVMNSYKLPPIHANMGNHDYYNIWINEKGAWSKETAPNGKTDAQSRERFMRTFGYDQPYHSVTIKGFQLIMMSQEAYVQEMPEVIEGAWYSDTQMNWLKDTLAQNKRSNPVFVMIHQPLPPIGQDGGSHQLIRAQEFREILKPYKNVFVFYGHNHQDFHNGRAHYFKESFHLFNNSSVGRVLNSRFEHKDQNGAQGLYVQVYRNKVVIRGREFSNRTWIEEANWTVPLTQLKA